MAFKDFSLLTTSLQELFCQQGQIEIDSQVYILHDNPVDFITNNTHDVYKTGCFFSSHEICDGVSKLLVEQQFNIEFTTISGTEFELVPKDINKANGMAVLSNHLNISFENIIAFGDNGNDLNLPKKAGFSVVVDNGVQVALVVDDYIAPSVCEDG